MEGQIVGSTIDYVIIIAYFIGVLLFGAFFARFNKSTRDFFFGGQRLSWWLISFSLVATLVGSYSFIKYSAAGFKYGLSSTMSYLNDWFLIPLFILGWLPIIYFSRVISIPEYFQKRFDRKTRIAAVCVILIYMLGYVGINFYTLGVALHALLGWPVLWGALFIAFITGIYVSIGGQTAVIMTDLLQGFLLLIAGFILFGLGLAYLGGFGNFWDALPTVHKMPFANFNENPSFNFVGIFWQDGIGSSMALYFMNQGFLMRFLAVKSYSDTKRVAWVMVLILMPLAAIAVANAGWVGRAMHTLNIIPQDTDPKTVFVVVSNLLCKPGLFGFIMAALTAAMMSTVDTLINAISAVFVNDVWRPFAVKNREDKYYLRVAMIASIIAAIIGMLLVPIYMKMGSIYAAHGAFTAAVTPPMIIAIILGAFWKRYTPTAALWTLGLGTIMMFISIWIPQIVAPFSHGIPPTGGFKYIRALYGISISGFIAVVVTFFTKPKPVSEITGLVINSVEQAKAKYKGGVPTDEKIGKPIKGVLKILEGSFAEKTISIYKDDMATLFAEPGDLLYVADKRRWLGGLRSAHVKVIEPHNEPGIVKVDANAISLGSMLVDKGVRVEKIM